MVGWLGSWALGSDTYTVPEPCALYFVWISNVERRGDGIDVAYISIPIKDPSGVTYVGLEEEDKTTCID